MKFGGGRDGGLVQDPGHCVGELVVIRGDRGVTGTYFLWWWDPGHCVGELVVIRG